MTKIKFFGLLAFCLPVIGCSVYDAGSKSVVAAISPYRIKIVQGNVVTKQMVDRLKTGMSQTEVVSILGTPLLTDIFHANRWDYIFSVKSADSDVIKQRRFTVFFEDQKLVRTIGENDLPNEADLIAEMDGKSNYSKQTIDNPLPNPRKFPHETP